VIRTTNEFLSIFRAARRVSTPLICARTADPASALGLIQESLNGKAESVPVTVWDILSGLRPANAAAKENLCRVLDECDPSTVGPTDALVLAAGMADDSVLVFSNAHRFWHDPAVAQGIWNLRDHFKSTGSMLVLLAAPGAALPTELSQDVLVLDEPLPSADDLARIVKDTFAAAEIDELAPDVGRRAVDALLGLSAFPAEQALAMSLAKSGLDTEQLWERKRQVIEQTPGLSVWRGGESFADIGGCENIKRFLGAVLAGEEAPRVVVFVDEIEKAFSGTGTDLSGVKTEMTGTMLSWMQDREADGVVLIGPAGTAKSAVAKAAGTAAGIPTIAFDFGAMQNSLVGASGERLRSALQVVDAVSSGRSLWIATCNSIGVLPPELRRRFTLGTFFFDLPTKEERATIWKIYLAKYGVAGARPDDEGWTGAEIKECCRKAYRLRISLPESAQYIVPVSRSAAEQIKVLRQQASGKFLSASQPGVYQIQDGAVLPKAGRAFRDLESAG
jgi:hypothetical protein